jgi:hypothetical protein
LRFGLLFLNPTVNWLLISIVAGCVMFQIQGTGMLMSVGSPGKPDKKAIIFIYFWQ